MTDKPSREAKQFNFRQGMVRALIVALAAATFATSSTCRRRQGNGSCSECEGAKLVNAWCNSCNVGYVAAVPIKNKILHESLDAHGHDMDLSTITCKECQANIPREGFCETCRIGWVKKQAYFSRLTFHLAKGRPVEHSTIRCDECRKNTTSYGWCDRCRAGMVGNVVISNRADFDGACRGYELMLAAIRATEKCETCGLAILTDTACFFCKTAYKDGLPVPKAATAPALP